ncbi:L-threonylcarbamoyladenylate synthase [Nitriliruptor alkaliphilus]|uniref:L-threonylcarbamoyladenylate synthase n=1 Tax=Nitriliruptor alkaliphilus TaxID=427918 RepID=UPI000698BA29|nr:L-threonylcarbamoyladenylate synthase [Nitriliruptor alkaliphilus]
MSSYAPGDRTPSEPTVETRTLPPTEAGLAEAGRLLRAGRLVAFPTETVYGLGADAADADAVARTFTAKGRPADNPLIVHVGGLGDLDGVVHEVTPLAVRLADRFWPGPLTLVLAAHPNLPRVTTAGLDSVAVRVPDHPVARRLLASAGVPVAAPSANRSGRPSPTSAAHVLADLAGRIDAVVDGGPCTVGVESTVVDARGEVPLILREGSVTREDLGVALDAAGVGSLDLDASPGTRHRHYQPACRVELAPAGTGPDIARRLAAEGARVGLIARGQAPGNVVEVARFDTAEQLAAILYGALRDAELAAVDVVVVEEVADVGIGRALMDRLRRAAA